MNIYVGNLSYQATEEDLRNAFESFGQVESATIIKDKYTGQSKGFGFVEMPSDAEARSAIEGLNGKDVKGRALNVNEARPVPTPREAGTAAAVADAVREAAEADEAAAVAVDPATNHPIKK